MTTSALWPIQAAVYSALTADTALMALVQGVFDAVPDQQPYPYIVVGDATEVPFNSFGRSGSEVTVTLHVWSQYAGFHEALAIAGQAQSALDDAELAVAGFGLVLVAHEETTTLRDPDGITRHVVSRYRAIVQEGE